MKARAIIMALVAAIVVQCGVVTPPAFADRDDRREGRHYRRDRDRDYRHDRRRHRQRRYYRAPRAYYYEPEVYYAPPPVYYPPPPPSIGFSLIFPFRID